MPLHKNLTGSELHFPLGRASEGALSLDDDQANAYQIKQGSENLLNISTTNSAEAVTIGNATTNPDLYVPGDGKIGLGTSDPQEKVHIHDGHFLLHNDSGGSMRMTFARDNTGGSFGASNKVYQIETPADMSETRIQVGTAGSTSDALVIDSAGAMRLASEVSTPSDPGAGNGGFVYVKSDGKLYFRSATTTETDLTAGGGGVTNPLSADLSAGGFHIKFNADTGIKDDADNDSLLFGKTTSAVNHFAMINAAAGGEATTSTSTAPTLRSVGSSPNVDLALEGQGTGTVTIRSRGTDPGTLTINNTSNSYGVNLRPPADLGADYTLTLPADDGNANQVLETNGSGVLSWVDPASGGGLTVETKTGDATLTGSSKFVLVNTTSGAITITLPTASGISGAGFVIKDTGNAATNAITIATTAGETIDASAADLLVNVNFASVELISDGSNYWIR